MKFQNWILNHEFNQKIKQTKFQKRNNKKQRIFVCMKILYPSDFNIINYNRKPVAVFNPGITIHNDKLILFPRLVFDYYQYVSSIGYTEIPISDFPNSIRFPLNTKIIQYPTTISDIWGNEDSRGYKDWLLWVKLGKNKETNFTIGKIDFQNQTIFNKSNILLRRKHVLLKNEKTGRDFAVLNSSYMLCRPERNIKYSGITTWHRAGNDCYLDWQDLRFLLKSETWEKKIGWSTNVVKISKDLNLIGWHAINKVDYGYYNGLAIIDNDGDLQGISDYLLWASGLNQIYGDRTNVIFGCGLVLINKSLYWIGGISDYSIGIFKANLDTALNSIIWK